MDCSPRCGVWSSARSKPHARRSTRRYSQQIIAHVCVYSSAVPQPLVFENAPRLCKRPHTAVTCDRCCRGLDSARSVAHPLSSTDAPTCAQRCHSTQGGNTLRHGPYFTALLLLCGELAQRCVSADGSSQGDPCGGGARHGAIPVLRRRTPAGRQQVAGTAAAAG